MGISTEWLHRLRLGGANTAVHLGCEEACRQMVAGVAGNAGVFAVAKGAALMVPPG